MPVNYQQHDQSKNIVDAYIFRIIEVSNTKSEYEDFGWLDVDDCTCAIRQNLQNSSNFSKQILVSQSQTLCKYTFFPILLRNHFMFLWFDSTTSCLTLADSAPKNGIRDAAILLNSYMVFLSNFDFSASSTSFEHI